MMLRSFGAVLWLAIVFQRVLPGQDDALRRAFEGKTVVVKLDMPGDDGGINLYPQREDPADYRKIGEAIKRYGAALRKGDEVVVTEVHLKPKLIEFQLGGGGFGSWSDTAGRPSVPSTYVEKSNREKSLEKERNGASADRRKSLDRELDSERRMREREETRLRAIASRMQIEQQEWERERRLRSGSRFNLHFPNGVPPEAAAPEAIMASLREFVDFTVMAARPQRQIPAGGPESGANPGALRKGMSEEEVASLIGMPQSRRASDSGAAGTGGLPVVDSIYDLPGSTVTAVFVNGVLAKFTIASK